ARGFLDYMLRAIPDLMSIHPMSIDQPDEELIILGQLFSSTMIEGTYYVPSFARWLTEHDRVQCYRDLKQILQSLQWQDQSRKGAKWVLKTPGHLLALDAVIAVFPEAKIVMTHRDPVATVPSYSSMEHSLYRMVSDSVDPASVAAFWVPRLADLLDRFMAVRGQVAGQNFIDVRYADLLGDPIGEGVRVLAAAGVDVTDAVRAGMAEWIEANKREDRAPHKYALEDFGLDRSDVEQRFAAYRAAFLGGE
ncbi:MAG: sulfotransferase family protein, partial [Sphingopyxis sp.]